MFNREIILPKATEVTNMVISHCNNIRSKISGAAIDSLKDLFRFLKKALIQNLEFGVKERCPLVGSVLWNAFEQKSTWNKVSNGWRW